MFCNELEVITAILLISRLLRVSSADSRAPELLIASPLRFGTRDKSKPRLGVQLGTGPVPIANPPAMSNRAMGATLLAGVHFASSTRSSRPLHDDYLHLSI
ncbi:hypothetical protein POX_c04187 [Penicillium oxalicum]|uniref:hypothetical protein n=1 Tax=Penicillium oxalicum TaxID=69781 RepID=UPI0020B88CEF|nr:hypothetical protein POX_c04187 [Penicillium oxalicum]KAI2791330.1 hypothetical protein POX_c04187 [Penicillium oxalicum]